MDKAYIDKHHIVDRYVQGKLSEELLETFEVYMLEHPEVVDEIEFAQGMQAALKDRTSPLSASQPSLAKQERKAGFFLGPTWAVAATLLFGVSAAWSVYLTADRLTSAATPLQQPLPIGAELWLEPQRGVDGLPRVGHDDAGFLMSIDVASEPAETYQVTLTDAAGRTVWSVDRVQADEEQLVRLVVPPLPESSGAYVVTVASQNRPEEPFARYELLARDSLE